MTWSLVSGVVYASISGLGVLQIAYSLHRLLRSDRSSLNAVSFVFLLMFSATGVSLLMGLAGLLRPLPMALFGGGIVLLTWRIGPDGIGPRRVARSLAGFVAEARTWWRGIPPWLKWLTVIGVTVSSLRFAFLIWALPPFVWDALTYHLTNVAAWTQQGRIGLFEAPVARIYSPANFEVLSTWLTVFIHHDMMIEAAGIPSYILAVLAVYATTRGLGLSRSGSLLGALAYGSTPALLLATTGTKNDPQVAAVYLGVMALGVDLYRRRDGLGGKTLLGQSVLIVLMALYAVGTKIYIVHMLPGLALVVLSGAWAEGTLRSFLGAFRDSLPSFRQASTGYRLALSLALAAGIFLGGYWNVRNWVLTGNPFYPYGVTIGNEQIIESGDRIAHLGLDTLVENLRLLADKFGDRLGPIQPDLPNTTGWGWFAYVLGVPSFLWGLVRRRRLWPVMAGFLASLVVLFLSDRPSPWNMRYAIWFPAVFSVTFGAFWDWLAGEQPLHRILVAAVVGGTLGLNVAMVLNYNRISTDDFETMLSRPVWEREAGDFHVSVPLEYSNALAYVPRTAVLGYNVTSNGFIYPLFRADFSQDLVYIPFSADESCERVAEAMRERNTRYLFVAPEHTSDEKISFLRRCADSGEVLRERARGLYVINESG